MASNKWILSQIDVYSKHTNYHAPPFTVVPQYQYSVKNITFYRWVKSHVVGSLVIIVNPREISNSVVVINSPKYIEETTLQHLRAALAVQDFPDFGAKTIKYAAHAKMIFAARGVEIKRSKVQTSICFTPISEPWMKRKNPKTREFEFAAEEDGFILEEAMTEEDAAQHLSKMAVELLLDNL